ncbi:hypothetical protein [Gracilibacillus kekensis]|uniref:ABC-2 type transport system permease protein n=1 Tax=Gracilibacillus kekensis TaxID=1027249 RepID=A0A1M7MJ75_9BACI|nr:hypothetical protein [Gracilibacillus kekensis]SHM91065.1 hypothetical protein SAMN05216179_1245 [Gracilibacillus kekensis]
MSIYRGLWKKEMSMMRGFQISFVVVIFCLMFYSLYAILKEGGQVYSYIIDVASIGFIIIPATLLFSLNMETLQLNQILFNKNVFIKQMIIKILHGLMLMVGFYLYTFLFGTLLALMKFWTTGWSEIVKLIFSLFITVLPIGLALSITVYIGWVFHQWLKPKLGFALSIISTLIILYWVFLGGIGIIMANVTFMKSWWVWNISERMYVPLLDAFFVNDQLSISMLLFFTLLYSLVFWLTSWLFKKKVEV